MILVFGGAFNPPTNAHLEIINGLIQKYKPNKFIVIPVGNHYNKRSLALYEDRVEMLKLIAKEVKMPIEISNIEQYPPFLGTYEALQWIQLQNPTEEIYFVLGTDHLTTLNTWISAKELLRDFNFIIVRRKNYITDFATLKSENAKFEIFDFNSEITSTKFRLNMEKFKADVLPEVYDYIKARKLYGGD